MENIHRVKLFSRIFIFTQCALRPKADVYACADIRPVCVLSLSVDGDVKDEDTAAGTE